MARKPRQVEEFDVAEFLRSTDQDIRSALHSMLGSAPTDKLEAPVNLGPPVEIGAPVKISPPPVLDPPVISIPPIKLSPPVKVEAPPELKLVAKSYLPSGRRGFTVREAQSAEDGHSRSEQLVWLSLWEQGSEQADGTRLVTIGFLSLARLTRLSESNARINLRSLIRKLAVEEHSSYVCEQSQGRTYRVFSAERIFERRRDAGLLWYAKRTNAIVFVDPRSGAAL